MILTGAAGKRLVDQGLDMDLAAAIELGPGREPRPFGIKTIIPNEPGASRPVTLVPCWAGRAG